MNSVWYKFRSATTWRELQIPSTFLTIGEMRQLICKELHLQEQETVLLSENGDDNYRPLADEKQFPRGSRFWARRTTLDHIRREKEVLEQAQRANEAQEAEDGAVNANDDSDDDFGPDLFDRDAQLKYEERERRTQLEAVAEQIKEDQKHDLKESMRLKDGARPSASLDDKAVAKVDHKRVSVRVVDEEDDMDIDWESIIEQRKTSKAGEVKQEPTDTPEDGRNTALATVSHAVTAAQAPGDLLEAHEDKEDPKSNRVAEKPAVPSLLETYPQLLNICAHILPNAPLKQLYLAFPNARPRTRAEWEAFQNAQREAQKEVDEMRNKTETHGRGPRASSPVTSPRGSRHPQRHSRDRDISPSAADSPRRSHHDHEPRRQSSRSRTSRSQSRQTPACRSPYEGGYEGGTSYPGRSSRSPDASRPRRRQRGSRQRSYSSDRASDRRDQSQSPPFERFTSRSRSPSESEPPRRRERERSYPEQDLRYASDAPAAHPTRHRSPYGGGSSRGGLRGRAQGGGSGSEHNVSDQKSGGRSSYEPPKDLRRRPPNREGSYTPPPDRKRAAEKSSPGHTVPRGRKHANSSGGFARRALGGIIR